MGQQCTGNSKQYGSFFIPKQDESGNDFALIQQIQTMNKSKFNFSPLDIICQDYFWVKINSNKKQQCYLTVFENYIFFGMKETERPKHYMEFSQKIQFLQVYEEDQKEDFQELKNIQQSLKLLEKKKKEKNLVENFAKLTQFQIQANKKRSFMIEKDNKEIEQIKKFGFIRIYFNEYQFLEIKPAKKQKKLDKIENNSMLLLRNHLKKKLVQQKILNSYKIISVLGSGSFAVVYMAINRETKEKVAIKVFSKQKLSQTKTGYTALENEIEIMRQIDQKNILKLREVYETTSQIYLVMDLHTGGSLHERIVKKVFFTVQEVQKIMYQLLESLAYLHEQGIMHRDLKPDNILFRDDESLNCVLADLGLAQKVDAPVFLFTRCGTFGYVAPEIWRAGDKFTKYKETCDIYSLGIIFNIITTGKSPFQDMDSNSTKLKNKRGYINFNEPFYEKLSPQCFDLLQKLLENDENIRITAKQALKHEFFADKNQISRLQIKKNQQLMEKRKQEISKLKQDFQNITIKNQQVQQNIKNNLQKGEELSTHTGSPVQIKQSTSNGQNNQIKIKQDEIEQNIQNNNQKKVQQNSLKLNINIKQEQKKDSNTDLGFQDQDINKIKQFPISPFFSPIGRIQAYDRFNFKQENNEDNSNNNNCNQKSEKSPHQNQNNVSDKNDGQNQQQQQQQEQQEQQQKSQLVKKLGLKLKINVQPSYNKVSEEDGLSFYQGCSPILKGRVDQKDFQKQLGTLDSLDPSPNDKDMRNLGVDAFLYNLQQNDQKDEIDQEKLNLEKSKPEQLQQRKPVQQQINNGLDQIKIE